MTAFSTRLRRMAACCGRWMVTVAAAVFVGVLEALALVWVVIAATPDCGQPAPASAFGVAHASLVGVGVSATVLAVLLGARLARARWGWLLWAPVCLLAAAAPAVVWVALPKLIPATGGGLFCL